MPQAYEAEYPLTWIEVKATLGAFCAVMMPPNRPEQIGVESEARCEEQGTVSAKHTSNSRGGCAHQCADAH